MILGLEAWIFWLIVMVIFIAVEVSTFNLVTIWFALGALFGLIADLCGLPVHWQVLIACVVSAITLILVIIFKPFDKYKRKKNIPTNSDRVIGQTAVVLSKINSIDGAGAVKVMGQVWSAVSADGGDIFEGETVKVLNIAGVKLVVEKIKEN